MPIAIKRLMIKLTPVIKRLHGGNLVHGGKFQKGLAAQSMLKKKVKQLKE